ncbi:type II toxin-antitoxin system RelE/ParE family toxin, partial [Arthrospira platensis SPKY1]|nr:type II toxin-antitoxin system RelE/ParE family toxin [Arthrospira platensis SPKY1]
QFVEIVTWYEQKDAIGHLFASQLAKAYGTIATHPKAWPVREEGIRRYRMKRFPYYVFYELQEKAETVVILAILHQKRQGMGRFQ